MTPIYSGLRWFLGQRDLVVSLRTRGCRFGCTFCNLPSRSLARGVTPDEVILQMEAVWASHGERLAEARRLSLGCEGSLLDSAQLSPESLATAFGFVRDRLLVDTVSVETRPEFLTDAALGRLRRLLPPRTCWDATIGLETVDDRIRNGVLGKRFTREAFERAAEAMARVAGTLTVYVMIKPLPWMTEAAAIEDGTRTLGYLIEVRERYGVPVVAYLNPMYLARGTKMAREARIRRGSPPTVGLVLEMLERCRDRGLPAYLGAWSEGMAEENGDWGSSPDWDDRFGRQAIAYNRGGDFSVFCGHPPRLALSEGAEVGRSS